MTIKNQKTITWSQNDPAIKQDLMMIKMWGKRYNSRFGLTQKDVEKYDRLNKRI